VIYRSLFQLTATYKQFLGSIQDSDDVKTTVTGFEQGSVVANYDVSIMFNQSIISAERIKVKVTFYM